MKIVVEIIRLRKSKKSKIQRELRRIESTYYYITHFVGPDLGPNCLQRLSADIKSLPQRAKSQIQNNLWLKPWLKLILFGSNFFHLAKVLATTNSEPG